MHFWRRLFAFCLDGLLLGALGAGIGLFAYDGLAALGDWRRLEEDVIAISIVYGYDIGIASSWRGRNFAFSPDQWRKRSAPL
jgi:hypothetical protein